MLKAPGLRIPASSGQHVLCLISDVINRSLKIRSQGQTLLIPLKRSLTSQELNIITKDIEDVSEITDLFILKSSYPRSLLHAVKGKIPCSLYEHVPKSLDIIGQVAIVKIPPQLMEWKELIGEAILAVNRNLETVLAKVSNIEGTWRLRHYSVLAGSGETNTVHKEYGCIYHLDPQKVYFSPRLSEERRRIASLVRAGEVVVDMFASIGAFAIQIATVASHVAVHAVDINPEAYQFLQRNIAANHISKTVYPQLGDVRLIADQYKGIADRVIMDLPERAIDFVDAACHLLKAKGGIIHFYGFASEPFAIKTTEQRLQTAVNQAGRRVYVSLYRHKLRQIAPHRWQIVIDARIGKS